MQLSESSTPPRGLYGGREVPMQHQYFGSAVINHRAKLFAVSNPLDSPPKSIKAV
jgi:hypothetical protein